MRSRRSLWLGLALLLLLGGGAGVWLVGPGEADDRVGGLSSRVSGTEPSAQPTQADKVAHGTSPRAGGDSERSGGRRDINGNASEHAGTTGKGLKSTGSEIAKSQVEGMGTTDAASPAEQPSQPGRKPDQTIAPAPTRNTGQFHFRVAISPDGARGAVSGPDRVVMWSPDSFKPLWSIDATTRQTPPLAFSPDGKRLAAQNARDELVLLNAADGKPVWTSACEAKVNHAAFRLDGRTILAASEAALYEVAAEDGKARLVLETLAGWFIARLLLHEAANMLVWMLSTKEGNRNRVEWRSLSSLEFRHEFSFENLHDPQLALSADGLTALIAVDGGRIIAVGTDGKEVTSHSFGTQNCGAYQAGRGRALLTPRTHRGASLLLWDVSAWREDGRASTGMALDVAATPDGTRAITMDLSGDVEFWHLDPGNLRLISPPSEGITFHCVNWMPDSRRILAGDAAGRLVLFDPHARRELDAWPVDTRPIESIVIAPTGDCAAVILAGMEVRLWRAGDRELRSIDATGFSRVQFSADGRSLWVCLESGVKRYDAMTCEETASFPGPRSFFALSPGGLTLAWHEDRSLKLMNTATRDTTAHDTGVRYVTDVTYSSDGKLLALQTTRGFTLWDAESPSQRSNFQSHWHLQFHPVNSSILTLKGSDYQLVDFEGGQIERLALASSAPWNVRISPDGKTLMALDDTRRLHFWKLGK